MELINSLESFFENFLSEKTPDICFSITGSTNFTKIAKVKLTADLREKVEELKKWYEGGRAGPIP